MIPVIRSTIANATSNSQPIIDNGIKIEPKPTMASLIDTRTANVSGIAIIIPTSMAGMNELKKILEISLSLYPITLSVEINFLLSESNMIVIIEMNRIDIARANISIIQIIFEDRSSVEWNAYAAILDQSTFDQVITNGEAEYNLTKFLTISSLFATPLGINSLRRGEAGSMFLA